jgi:transposase
VGRDQAHDARRGPLSQREIHRRTGAHRDTIRRALAAPRPPSYGPRAKRPCKLDPFMADIEELLVKAGRKVTPFRRLKKGPALPSGAEQTQSAVNGLFEVTINGARS